MTLFARFQETGTLAVSSGLLPICGSSNPLKWEFIFQAGCLALAPGRHCAFLYWTKCPNVQKNIPLPDPLHLAQVSSSPPPVKGTRSNHEGTPAMAWCCWWLQGQRHLPNPTSPPVHAELFATFMFRRENTNYGAAVNLEVHSCVHLQR